MLFWDMIDGKKWTIIEILPKSTTFGGPEIYVAFLRYVAFRTYVRPPSWQVTLTWQLISYALSKRDQTRENVKGVVQNSSAPGFPYLNSHQTWWAAAVGVYFEESTMSIVWESQFSIISLNPSRNPSNPSNCGSRIHNLSIFATFSWHLSQICNHQNCFVKQTVRRKWKRRNVAFQRYRSH